MHFLPLTGLLLSALYYCHRFYSFRYSFEGDALKFIYFRLHSKLVWADHNPYQWDSMAGFPTGEWNPLLYLVKSITSFLSLPPVTDAIVVSALLAFLTQVLLVCAFYFLFYHCTKSRAGAVIGSLIVSFTGFHLVGVREFNSMYAHSLLCTAGVLWVVLQFLERVHSFFLMGVLSFAVGLSLLGGTNSPLFFFLPWMGLYLLFCSRKDRTKTSMYFLGGVGLGVLLGSVAWLPKVFFLENLPRENLNFWDGLDLSFKDLWIGLFLPESIRTQDWKAGWWNVQETSFFVGAPVLLLAVQGILRKERNHKTHFFFFLFIAGFLMFLLPHFPRGVTEPLAQFYSWLSIRNPNRFWMMCLPSLGYFAAKGAATFPTHLSRRLWISVSLAFAVTWLLVYFPRVGKLLPEATPSILLTSLASVAAIFALIYKRKAAATAFIFLMYAWAPIQSTNTLSKHFSDLKRTVPESIRLQNVLGLTFDYPHMITEGKRLLTAIPEYLKDEETKKGKIFDQREEDQHSHYFAPVTGHRFGYSALRDLSTFKNVRRLGQLRTLPIMGMSNVCTLLLNATNKPDQLVRIHIPCLDFVYWVPSRKSFANDEMALNWMTTATLKDFSEQFVYLDSNPQQEVLPPLSNTGETSLNFIESPGSIRIEGKSSQKGYIVINTPYRKDWTANLNGKIVQPIRANVAYMALPVSAGSISLKLNLEPKGRTAAICLTGLGFILSLYLLGSVLRVPSLGEADCLA